MPDGDAFSDLDARLQAEALIVDVDGYEGPLDVLLTLARTQKVALRQISVLALARQYLAFVERAKSLRIELAADYLVMAAWLAFLKSKLLLPEPDEEEGPSGEDLANQLAFRLRRLEAMREASTRLMNRNRLGRDVFARGDPEPVIVHREQRYTATMYDLLSAYAAQKQRHHEHRQQRHHQKNHIKCVAAGPEKLDLGGNGRRNLFVTRAPGDLDRIFDDR